MLTKHDISQGWCSHFALGTVSCRKQDAVLIQTFIGQEQDEEEEDKKEQKKKEKKKKQSGNYQKNPTWLELSPTSNFVSYLNVVLSHLTHAEAL